jgi:hypothetical protein
VRRREPRPHRLAAPVTRTNELRPRMFHVEHRPSLGPVLPAEWVKVVGRLAKPLGCRTGSAVRIHLRLRHHRAALVARPNERWHGRFTWNMFRSQCCTRAGMRPRGLTGAAGVPAPDRPWYATAGRNHHATPVTRRAQLRPRDTSRGMAADWSGLSSEAAASGLVISGAGGDGEPIRGPPGV